MNGIIAIYEKREKVNAMSDYYQNSYRELVRKQRKIDEQAAKQQWIVNMGAVACKVGLVFTSPVKRGLGKLGVGLSQPILKWIIKKNADHQKETIEIEKERLTAEFINYDGEAGLFSITDTDLIQNVPENILNLETAKTR